MNSHVFIVFGVLSLMQSNCVAGNTIASRRQQCEDDFNACTDKNRTDCQETYLACLSKHSLPPHYEIFPPNKDDLVLNFKCCFKDLTVCLVHAKGNVNQIETCKMKMYQCTIFNTKKYKTAPNPKIAWVLDSPPPLRRSVIAHARCNDNSSMDDFCCSVKYQQQVEIMMIKECFNRLLECKLSGKTELYCQVVWSKCFVPDCSLCTECNAVFYSHVPLMFATREGREINSCKVKFSNVNDFLSCVLDLQITDLPNKELRRELCVHLLKTSTQKDTAAKFKEYKKCMIAANAVDIGMDQCYHRRNVNFGSR